MNANEFKNCLRSKMLEAASHDDLNAYSFYRNLLIETIERGFYLNNVDADLKDGKLYG